MRWHRGAAIFGLALLLLRPEAALAGRAQDGIRRFYDTLLNVMREGPALGRAGRYAQLNPAVRQLFDIPFMTQIAIGPDWASLDASQRRAAIAALGRYVSAIWADRFDSYSGEQLQVLGERADNAQTFVETRIVQPTGEPVSLNYLMRQADDGWRVVDVYLDGTISQLAMLRSEFHAILQDRGVAGLLAALDHKVDLLSRAAPPPAAGLTQPAGQTAEK